MSENPLRIFERLDPELLKLIGQNRDFANAGNALPPKFKCLLVMAIDAVQGAPLGVRANAAAALRAGATKEEIVETIRVVHEVCGAGSAYTIAHALENIF